MAVLPRPEEDVFRNRKSFVACRDAFMIYLKKGGKNLPLKDRMEITLQASVCEAVIGNITESEEMLSQCEEYILEHGKDEEKAAVYHVHCRLKIHHSQFSEGLASGLKALYIFRQMDLPHFAMTTSTCCGVACSNMNLFTEAIDFLTQSQAIAVEMGDHKDALLCSANLNEVRLRILSPSDCITFNKQMLADITAEYGTQPSTVEIATCLHLAHLYTQTKEYNLAESFADRGLAVISHFAYLPPYHFLYTNLYAIKADIAGGQGDEAGMLRYAAECSARAAQVKKISPEIDISFILFRYYLRQNDVVRAKSHLDRAATLIPPADRGAQYLDLNEHLCLYYKTIGDTAAELAHFKLIYEYKIKSQQESLENRVKYLATVHQLEIKKKEVEQHKAELDFKTQELNMTTYHLQQRTQLLSGLKENIDDLKKAKSKTDVVFRTITKAIDNAFVKEEVEKTRFREKFDEAHRGFIARLHQSYPELSPTECRVCTLLRSGFNTKEIASLLSTTARNIENHRLSIRRKMKLNRDENLNLILTTIE